MKLLVEIDCIETVPFKMMSDLLWSHSRISYQEGVRITWIKMLGSRAGILNMPVHC